MADEGGDTQFQKAFLSILLLAYQNGFSKALKKLAEFHNNEPGPWLDEIEAEVLDGIKSLVTEGLDITLEANALEAAITTASMFLAEFRRELTSKTNSD